jgi:hypothetical protein
VELELIVPVVIVELLLDVGVAAAFAAVPPLALARLALELDELLPQAAIAIAASGTVSSASFLRIGPPIGGPEIVASPKASQRVQVPYTYRPSMMKFALRLISAQ